MKEIFNTDLTLDEKIELASGFAMEQVNKVIEKHIEKFTRLDILNNNKAISVKYEDSDLYRLEQKRKEKREVIKYIDKLSHDDLEDIKDFLSVYEKC